MRIGLVGVGRIGAFHAETLASRADLVVTDANLPAARAIGFPVADDITSLLASGIDGLVIAAATPAHAPLLTAAVAAGVPTFCEKPVAATLAETLAMTALVEGSGVPVQIGFQRRFDAGYRRVREAVASGSLGFVHTIRANTHDQAPPPAAYIATSGGIFRDCSVHDFDILRFVTGREVVTAYATGANKGEPFFTAAGDVDTGAAVLTLDDGTLALVSATRYNGGGHDVRMEVLGSAGALGVGLDQSLALTSAEAGVDFPTGPRHQSFMDRFRPAYQAELAAFVDVVRGDRPSPCTVRDALEAFRVAEACELSRAEGRPVALAEIKRA
ncbi:myo-inositol 2-dehydrogenase/D-chiro-inositol 1-dehydrogenase [Asanoa ferruginea]|uniref:Myo-inositol 2-dehydrogenase/D-chiro-inositol 1-dehydrogenase n=1 Tax=Asanoa ferruginea TaxID=53367 RepID=A0A3D9ZPE8_9ACTN|nr:Gfo/Idh/MocA family oxidoreductase [Asanoa ferruginea]REF99246.1 myo-inositol 2-dehydrogenase/D-chiro-inositol 1-dehydrogenase [Asanoa ferruginea]GIF45844.1 oxidoreductase [Asanoa ferruginea]